MHRTSGTDWATADVLLGLAIITAVCVVARKLLSRTNQPPVIAEILAGLVMGPLVLGYLPGHLPSRLFPVEARPFLTVLANVGLVLFMFVVGFEIDLPAIGRMRGSAISVAASSVTVPFLLGMGLAWWINPAPASATGPASTRLVQSLFIGVAFSATAFPVLARILDDPVLKRLSIRNLALSAAAAGDVVAWAGLAAVVAMTRSAGSGSTVVLLLQFAALVVGLRYVARPLVTMAMSRRQGGGESGMQLGFGAILVGIFLCSWATTAMHIHPIFGAFAFGFACPRDAVRVTLPDLETRLTNASHILMPVFFVLTGLSMSVKGFGRRDIFVAVLIIVAATAGKIFSVYTAARLCRLPKHDSWGLGLLMNTRGLTELVILDVGRTAGVLSARMFTILAAMAVTTTLITGPLMARIYTDFGTGNRRRSAAPKPAVETRIKQHPVSDAAHSQTSHSTASVATAPADLPSAAELPAER